MTQRRKVLLIIALLSSILLMGLAVYLKIVFLSVLSVALFLIWMKYDPPCETSLWTARALVSAKNINKLEEEK